MFNTRKRMQETIDTQAKLIKNRDNFIEKQSEENHALYQENKALDRVNEELIDLLVEVNHRATSNNFGNAEVALRKIKELVKDYEANY